MYLVSFVFYKRDNNLVRWFGQVSQSFYVLAAHEIKSQYLWSVNFKIHLNKSRAVPGTETAFT